MDAQNWLALGLVLTNVISFTAILNVSHLRSKIDEYEVKNIENGLKTLDHIERTNQVVTSNLKLLELTNRRVDKLILHMSGSKQNLKTLYKECKDKEDWESIHL